MAHKVGKKSRLFFELAEELNEIEQSRNEGRVDETELYNELAKGKVLIVYAGLTQDAPEKRCGGGTN